MLFRSDRKSTRLNSSHTIISYAVFCLKKNTSSYSIPAPRQRRSPVTPPYARVSLAHTVRGVERRSHAHKERRGVIVGLFFFFLMIRHPPISTLFPSPPLSR